jgi:hypothetical protein
MATPRSSVGSRSASDRGAVSPLMLLLRELLGAMNAELVEMRALVAAFADQQDAIVHRKPARVIVSVQEVEKCVAGLREARAKRDGILERVARGVGAPPRTSIAVLVRVFPSAVRSAVSRLIEENVRLGREVRRKASQNQVLLTRSIEVIHEILRAVQPSSVSRIYGEDGRMSHGQPIRGAHLDGKL